MTRREIEEGIWALLLAVMLIIYLILDSGRTQHKATEFWNYDQVIAEPGIHDVR